MQAFEVARVPAAPKPAERDNSTKFPVNFPVRQRLVDPIAKAQASLADSQRAIFDGPNTDHDVTPLDRYDGQHFAASGQEKYTDAWIRLFRAYPRL